jgi:hypothetical protein
MSNVMMLFLPEDQLKGLAARRANHGQASRTASFSCQSSVREGLPAGKVGPLGIAATVPTRH